MLRKLSLTAVLILCFFTAGASAQERENANTSGRSDGLDQRVTERLKTLKTSLNDKQAKDIKTRCKSAQSKLKAIQQKSEDYSSAQNSKVNEILDNLDKLNQNLRSQGVDTSSTDEQIEKISQIKTDIKATYENYLLALSDSALIDCQSSPEGFRLSVDDAKKNFSELKELRKSQIDLIKVDLKNALINLRNEL